MNKKIKLINFIFAFCIALLLSIPVNVKAAEKNVTVTITNESKNATFTIQFAKGSDYTISVLSPDGKSYNAEKVSKDYYKCDVSNLKAGDWTVKIESESDDEIETANVTVKRSTSTESVVDNNIRVGKDIAELNMYFVDRTFHVTWQDETVGNVNIEVVNLDNGAVLDDTSVKEMSYELELDDNVKNIQVSVVPSTSASVDGAEQVYTFAVNSDINGTVAFDDVTITNQPEINVHAALNSSYSFYAEDNGTKIYEDTELKDAGEYDIPLKLSDDGEHNLVFYLIDESGNYYSTSKTVIKDTVAPTVTLAREYNNIKTYDTVVPVEGTVINYSELTINGENVSVTTDGSFSHDVTLHLGDNEIEIVAKDEAGNEAGYTCDIVVIEKEKPNILPFIIGGIVLILIIIGIIVKRRLDRLPRKPKTDAFNRTSFNKPSKFSKSDDEEPITLKKAINIFLGYGMYVVALFIILFVILDMDYVKSASMAPTVQVGDICVANRLAYIKHDVERGDIICFKHDGDKYSKRVIGIAGDKIEFNDGYVYINGEYYDETAYITDEDVETNCALTFEVPEGCVFVLGDNRENSLDARYWDNPYVSEDDIVSRQMFVIPTHVIRDIFVK